MNATDVLKQHHREIEELFRRLRHGEADPNERVALRVELADMIAAHTATEEDLFYPETLDLLGPACRVFEATEEHTATDFMLLRAMSVPAKSEVFRPRLETLYDTCMNHIEEEETELFVQFDSECDRSKSDELGDRMSNHFEKLIAKGHVAILSERVKLQTIGAPKKAKPAKKSKNATKKSKVRRGQCKPLSIGTLPRVFVNLLAQDGDGIVIFAETLDGCEEMKTWFKTTKTSPIDDNSAATGELRVRRGLSKFFQAVLNLSKVTRSMFVKDFTRLLNDLGAQDFWGTEGQCDPRGDCRDFDPYR